MLISTVSDETGGEDAGMSGDNGHGLEYQTASELFELMTKNTNFNTNDDEPLTTRDLILLYKNIDIGTKLMNDANEIKTKKPNRYVEAVVYNDEHESDSDLSEIYSTEDIHNVFMINQERLDFLNDKSLENLLCHKLGGLEIKSSDISIDYGKQLLFQDPYIKNQLKSLNVMGSGNGFGNIFSTSLIDYICCKRLEDNYNFYMDNIIRYVQHTIEQLKRISNGDYLSDRAKEIWREVNCKEQEANTKVLATSTSIPLHVECKNSGNATWDDIVHSEVDVRSLSKILEKKIVVEIPKLICGSYRLYSQRCADNLIISCQREEQIIEKSKESRVDVVLQLQRSQTGQVMSNISSIMVLQTSSTVLSDLLAKDILPLPYKGSNDKSYLTNTDLPKEPAVTVIEFVQDTDKITMELGPERTPASPEIEDIVIDQDQQSENDSMAETNDYPYSELDRHASCEVMSNQYSSESSFTLREILEKPFKAPALPKEAPFNFTTPDELRITMQRLNMQSSVLEEIGEDVGQNITTKKKSAIHVRIKSPYENKSYLLEEKKRKRLLEIRERREKRKMLMSENCKISKHKYGKGATMPQASTSVTKLSITNKSFYNSIYGQSLNTENKPLRIKSHKAQKNCSNAEVSVTGQNKEEYFESPVLTPEKNSKKYIDRCYYLDDAETEIMYMQTKQIENNDKQNTCSASNLAVSDKFNTNLNLLSQVIGPSHTNVNIQPACTDKTTKAEVSFNVQETPSDSPRSNIGIDVVPENTPVDTQTESSRHDLKKNVRTVECRKSIDKLYDLMKKLPKPRLNDLKTTKSRLVANIDSDGVGGNSTVQGSDSGTSVKHRITSSNPSCFSFEKSNIAAAKSKPQNKKIDTTTVTPKVIISSKSQTKGDFDKIHKESKRGAASPPPKPVPNNPLKAISQLLHEFDNVQKTRHKPEGKPKKVEVVLNDVRNISRQNYFRRRSRFDQHIKDNQQEKKVTLPHVTPKEKRTRPLHPTDLGRIPHQQTPLEEKHVERVTKKKIADIIDEAREARGEAVRGPSKFHSRLNSLAQPKKSYVQAHSEEYQTKYGRNLMADRLQRLAGTAPSAIERNVGSPTLKNRMRRGVADATSLALVKQPASPGSHLEKRIRSASSSPLKTPRSHGPAPDAFKLGGQISDAPGSIKKMVAVESYVKSHYGRGAGAAAGATHELLLAGHRSRVPLVPNDIELSSMTSSLTAGEANELGNKLHCMIDTMLSNATPLSALTECHESTSILSNHSVNDVNYQDPQTDSEYHIDILQDDLETAVENITYENKIRDPRSKDVPKNQTLSMYNLQPINSKTEMEQLENALYKQISGSFQKRLRIKTLTLTPKHSMQQVFLVQSGDAGSSLLVKSTVSRLKMNNCSTENLHDVKAMPVLSKSHLDWNFTQIPMQIATVGYAFSEYKHAPHLSNTRARVSEVSSIESSLNSSCKSCDSDEVDEFSKQTHPPPSKIVALVDTNHKIIPLAPSNIVDNSQQAIISPTITELHIKKSEIHSMKNTSDDSSFKNEIMIDHDNKVTITKINNKNSTSGIDNSDIPFKEPDNINIKNGYNTSETSPKPDIVDYTTSLDMLVGLLNEIQKITCQNHMTAGNDQNYKNDETVAKDATVEKPKINISREIVSVISSNDLRQLESYNSIYSHCMHSKVCDTPNDTVRTPPSTYNSNFIKSPSDENVAIEIAKNKAIAIKQPSENLQLPKAIYVDKEINVDLCTKEYVNSCTEVPSRLIPIVVNQSANVTNSVVGVISSTSTQSMLSFKDYETLYSNNLFRTPSIKTIVALSQVEVNSQQVIKTQDQTQDKANFNEKCLNHFSAIHIAKDLKQEKNLIIRSEITKYYSTKVELDPMFKIKRHILVTVYLTLVLTVFVALMFPELVTLFEE